MGQIVKRKKKGRPSKADLARRAATAEVSEAAAKEREVRRSLRRRNVRYTFDFDDFIDEDDEEDEEEDERRRSKKLKLLLKLQNKEGGTESEPSRTRRVEHAPASSSDSGDGSNPLKKRRIDGDDEVDGDANDDDDENDIENDDEEVGKRKAEAKGADSVPGTPLDPPLGLPLPEKKSLELILDKLQKKDTYGVYAEPVDPEELPDYHDVIEHPMDFATVRKKLANASYSTLEQFESDVFLICTNAMQYNAPDTIYHKQARAIHELAEKKFQRLRVEAGHDEKEVKADQKIISNSLIKKQIKKPMNRTAQEPVGSDFSSGAILAMAGDFQNGSNPAQAVGFEKLANVDRPLEGNTFLTDNMIDKVEDLQGRGLPSRFGRKSFMHDENRRATYNNSNEPVGRSESIFTTFDGEIKQLVAVGLHADHSYARSLARFAATLGPIGWKVASRRIEQALPPGFKYGRGWVGDYEPLPTPVLMLENRSQKEPEFLTNSRCTSGARKDDESSDILVHVQEHQKSSPSLEAKSALFGTSVTKPSIDPTASHLVSSGKHSVRGVNLEAKQSFLASGGSKPTTTASVNYQQQTSQSRGDEREQKVVKKVELDCPPSSTNQNTRDFVAEKQIPNGSRSMDSVSRNRNLLQSVSFKQPENNAFLAGGSPKNAKVLTNSLDRNRMVSSASESIPSQIGTASSYFPHGQEQQGLSDPVQLMRMMAGNAQKQQKSSNHSSGDNPFAPSSRRDDSNNAAAAAARAWMSIGAAGPKAAAENIGTHKNQISADSLYNPTRELHAQLSRFRGDVPVSAMQFQPVDNSYPPQGFVSPPVRVGDGTQFQNGPMGFPQIVTADLSRFQVQSPWEGQNPQRQQRQKQESLPPDLNIGFQSSGSPVRQSSGVLVDSQQPDLALQL